MNDGYLPTRIRHDNHLSPSARLLYFEITTHTAPEKGCTITNKEFGAIYHVSLETVSRWIRELEERGYIRTLITQSETRPRQILPLVTADNTWEGATLAPIDKKINRSNGNSPRGIYLDFFPEQRLTRQQWRSIDDIQNIEGWRDACKFWSDNNYLHPEHIGKLLAYMKEQNQPKYWTGFGKNRQSMAEAIEALQGR